MSATAASLQLVLAVPNGSSGFRLVCLLRPHLKKLRVRRQRLSDGQIIGAGLAAGIAGFCKVFDLIFYWFSSTIHVLDT